MNVARGSGHGLDKATVVGGDEWPYANVKAHGTITNPGVVFPQQFTFGPQPIPMGAAGPTQYDTEHRLIRPTRLDVAEGRVTLLFDRDSVCIRDKEEHRGLISPRVTRLLHFVCFRTLIDYRSVGFARYEDGRAIEGTAPSQRAIFLLGRFVPKFVDEVVGGRAVRVLHREYVDHEVLLERSELDAFLKSQDTTLLYAMAFFLRGCENLEYCLVEFYKSVESIQEAFKGSSAKAEKAMKAALTPFGFDSARNDDLCRMANDKKIALSIGRHAPILGGTVVPVDFSRGLSEPNAEALFTQAYVACRGAVDAYFAYRRSVIGC